MGFELRLQTRIFIAFFLVMVVFVFYSYFHFVKEIKEQFQYYEKIAKERSIIDIVNYLEAVYRQDRAWSIRSGQDIVRYVMRNAQTVTLMNAQREIIWKMDKQSVLIPSSSLSVTQRKRHIALDDKHHLLPPFLRKADMTYEEIEKPLLYDGWRVGYVVVGSYTQNSLQPEGMHARQYLLINATGTAFLGLLMAGITSLILARFFSEPLRNLTQATVAMQTGSLNHNLQDNSGTLEIGQLTRAINYLALALKEQRALRKRLTSDISHELRTPLNALLALSEAYIDEIMPVTIESLETLRGEILRLTTLVSELSKINDLEEDDLILKKEKIELYPLLRNLSIAYEQLSIKNNLKFKASIHLDVIIHADINRLKQAIINLLSNAIKYTSSGGSIELRSYQDDKYIYVQVFDSGLGIPDEEKSHVFERLYRLDQSRNRGTGGLGLGLTLVKKIIDAHRWNIGILDNKPKGSIFSIMIPK